MNLWRIPRLIPHLSQKAFIRLEEFAVMFCLYLTRFEVIVIGILMLSWDGEAMVPYDLLGQVMSGLNEVDAVCAFGLRCWRSGWDLVPALRGLVHTYLLSHQDAAVR